MKLNEATYSKDKLKVKTTYYKAVVIDDKPTDRHQCHCIVFLSLYFRDKVNRSFRIGRVSRTTDDQKALWQLTDKSRHV